MFFRLTFLIAIASLVAAVIAIVAFFAGGNWGPAIATGAAVVLLLLQGSLLYFSLQNRDRYLDLEANPEVRDLQQAREEFKKARAEVQRELETETGRLDRMSQKISDKFRVIHEWLDTPMLIDVNDDALSDQNFEIDEKRLPDSKRKQFIEQDKQVAVILERQAERMYEKIRKNTYAPTGKFDTLLFRDDIMQLATDVAHVYQPDVDNPLLRTSPEKIARALNRTGLHLLVVMDQLPLDLKTYDVQKTYDTVRRAVTAYGNYKKAAPYLNWASKGLFFGRMVSSTNPIALGIWWGASELGKFGVQKAATHFIDRQAIALLQSVIRVVGHEVAGIYGGDFRYRDANWCLGVELTHMLAELPQSRETLQAGLKEIARLQVRNEYDRIALYQSVAAGKSISRRTVRIEMLTESERKQILGLLETIFHESAHGQQSKEAEKWKEGLQEHLGLQLTHHSGKGIDPPKNKSKQDQEILELLIGYLIGIKQRSFADAKQLITADDVYSRLKLSISKQEVSKQIDQLYEPEVTSSDYSIEPPDLDPADPRVDGMLEVLFRWNAALEPLAPEAEVVSCELGLYYRQEYAKIAARQHATFKRVLLESNSTLAHKIDNLPPDVCRSLTYLHEKEKSLDITSACYPTTRVNWATSATASQRGAIHDERLRLLVFAESLLLIESPTDLDYP